MKKTSTFAERLKEYRTRTDKTLKELEEISGIPAQTLNRYELEQRIPKIDIANNLAEALGVNTLWLQGYDINERISRETNSYEQSPGNSLEYDPEISILNRESQKMSTAERKKMLNVLRATFDEYNWEE